MKGLIVQKHDSTFEFFPLDNLIRISQIAGEVDVFKASFNRGPCYNERTLYRSELEVKTYEEYLKIVDSSNK